MTNLKKLAVLSAALAMGGLMNTSAFATAVDSALAARSGMNVILTDESGEFAVDADQNGKLSTGDLLAGALDFTTISPNQTFFQSATEINRELTAVFANKIVESTTVGTFVDLRLEGAGSAFWTTNHAWLGGTNYKAMVDATFVGNTIDWDKVTAILFDDAIEPTGTDFDRSTGTIPQGMADASDGLIRAVIGFDSADDFWIARAKEALSAFETTVSNQGSFITGQTFLAENFSVDFAKVDAVVGGASYIGSPYATDANVKVDIAIDGALFGSGNDASSGMFTIFNKLDATVKPIPEPATLGLLGLGLLGLVAMRRKA